MRVECLLRQIRLFQRFAWFVCRTGQVFQNCATDAGYFCIRAARSERSGERLGNHEAVARQRT